MSEHPSRAEITALLQGSVASKREIEILFHLLRPCEECLAQAPFRIRALLKFDGGPAQASQDAAKLEAAVDRVLREARKHARRRHRDLKEAKKAEEILAQGGMEAAEKLPAGIGTLAGVEALLARSWAVRHENPRLMAQLAFLAAKRAEELSARRYGIKQVYDFRCRAEAELGNAYRAIDQLAAAGEALGKARRFFEEGTKNEFLEARLLSFEASLDADLRNFDSARLRLSKAHKIYLNSGDLHLAGRTLVQTGLYTSDAGRDEEALTLLKKSLDLIDSEEDPALGFAARLNILLILIDLGRFEDAKIQLFHVRALQHQAGGRINQVRLRWLEGRLEAGLGRFARAEAIFREVRDGFLEVNRAYDSALTSLDLAGVLLAQKRAREATEVVAAAYKIFMGLGINREAQMAVMLLRTACEMRQATREMAESVARYLRKLQIDPNAQYAGPAIEE